MRLTKRFFAMNALAVLGSIALTMLAATIFVAAHTAVFGPKAKMDEWKRSYEIRTGIGEIKRFAEALSFEQLLDQRTQRELSDRVKLLGADAVILKNREVIFSTAELDKIDLEKSLMLSDNTPSIDTLQLNNKTFLFARTDYRLSSGEEGVLLLLAPFRMNTGFFMTLGLFTAGFFIITFLIMNFWVSYRFSQRIIIPVSRLNEAAAKISEGDISGGIAEEGEDEVKELSRTLELMRIKLKESVYLQRKYDENRKFLVSSISHDLKTPVAAIQGYIEGIMDGVAKTPEKMNEYLETARSKAILVNAMIDDLLLYSRLDLNQIPYHFEKTDVKQYFEDCVTDHRYEYEKAGVALSLICEWNETVFVSIDRERFQRVVQNILDNAKKYMDKQGEGRVDIVLRETRTSAVIEIKDNGHGIPEDHLPFIFERFYRADASRKSAEGSGLGLAIAKQIVEDHEGKIWVASSVGEGTRMMISLKKV
ncbi:sensor histidine kinase [Paenibacillus thermotolerans]|uniref:sensor histidine kinase n=1 Tax=Paenibacillus thermotolerans TaxID=3027807 RepID=UPI002368A566|nr:MULTISPECIES: HAMP domain-containing sensor histidine kinase [unclassified Paenibacillus]